jgi:hypothetical protein
MNNIRFLQFSHLKVMIHKFMQALNQLLLMVTMVRYQRKIRFKLYRYQVLLVSGSPNIFKIYAPKDQDILSTVKYELKLTVINTDSGNNYFSFPSTTTT